MTLLKAATKAAAFTFVTLFFTGVVVSTGFVIYSTVKLISQLLGVHIAGIIGTTLLIFIAYTWVFYWEQKREDDSVYV